MKLRREKYLNDLILRMNNGLIKVVTGIRRCGKSFLLFELFYEYLLTQGIDDNHIIKIALDDDENENLLDYHELGNYIRSRINTEEQFFVFLDEVQLCDNFEKVLNGLNRRKNLDIYVTGSNSKFLSTDIITEFRGRGDEIHIMPLTFREFMEAYDGDEYRGWAEYSVYGGMPLTLTMRDDEQKMRYLSALFEETYLKDIIERNHIKRTQELEDTINILASAIGSLTNPNRIKDTFSSKMNSGISLPTIKNYIDSFEEAYIISKAQRYNVKGRKYIDSPYKYYFEDIGLRNARLGFRQPEENHIMENVIYNELRYRGYSVDVGVVETRKRDDAGNRISVNYEIDFVANKGTQRYYIQSAFAIPDMDKERQEKQSLLEVGDSFKKIVIVKDVIKVQRDVKGIVTMSLFDFLLDENSLDK